MALPLRSLARRTLRPSPAKLLLAFALFAALPVFSHEHHVVCKDSGRCDPVLEWHPLFGSVPGMDAAMRLSIVPFAIAPMVYVAAALLVDLAALARPWVAAHALTRLRPDRAKLVLLGLFAATLPYLFLGFAAYHAIGVPPTLRLVASLLGWGLLPFTLVARALLGLAVEALVVVARAYAIPGVSPTGFFPSDTTHLEPLWVLPALLLFTAFAWLLACGVAEGWSVARGRRRDKAPLPT